MPTRHRIYRIAQTLHRRQQTICVALDGVHDPHNLSAILRTADATGISKIYWQPDTSLKSHPNPDVSKGAEKWVELTAVECLEESLQLLKAEGFSIAATHIHRDAVDFRQIDWTLPWVVVMGNEQRGCRSSIVDMADKNIFLPMLGMVESLNVSVATAVVLYEIQRQRNEAGMYMLKASEKRVHEYYSKWDLAKTGVKAEDLLVPPFGRVPELEFPHEDGRSRDKRVFKKPEQKP